MQSSSESEIQLPSGKTETDIVPSSRTVLQTIPLTLTSQPSAPPFSYSTTNTTFTNSGFKSERSNNGNSTPQNNRFTSSNPLSVTPYHIPKGSATVASISVSKAKLASSAVRATPVPQIQPVTTLSSCTASAFAPALNRPVTTWVVSSSAPSTILQKTANLNVVSPTHVRPSNTLTVTSRLTAPNIAKPSETVKPIILHNTPKQIIAPTSNQFSDRTASGMLKTNVGVVTIRGSTIGSNLPLQTKVAVPAPSTPSPRLTMLVPTANAGRKPQTLAPKVITQTTRAPFTVQSIPVSVSHTPSALTINKKTAGMTIGTSQSALTSQNTSPLVRASPTVVGSSSMITISEIRPSQSSTNVFIQATPKSQCTVPSNTTSTSYSSNAKTYMFESENLQVKRTLVSSSSAAFTSSINALPTTSVSRHFNVMSTVNTNQIPRLNPIMVVETPRVTASVAPASSSPVQSSALIPSYVIPQGTTLGPVQQQQLPPSQQQLPLQQQQPQQLQQPPPSQLSPRISPVPQQMTNLKQNASPRPSILRKRDIDGSMAKAQRNLTPLLNSVPSSSNSTVSPPPSPHMTDIGGGQSSNSSSTLSATSSPGLPNIDPESPSSKIDKPPLITQCDEEHLRSISLVEMSPRKKPRKQQLTGNLTNEPKLEDDIEFISDDKIKKDSKETLETGPADRESQKSSASKKPNISILSGYNYGWKSRHHHFLRHSDVKYKEEKKPSVSDIANQKYVTQKINGWKIYHLSAQMENLHDIELEVVDKLSSLLKLFSNQEEEEGNKILNRTNELIKGNMQRSKVVSDQLIEAKSQIMKVFNHKKHVSDIINKYASKRTIKKKGRY